MAQQAGILWLTRDLRLADNPALLAAIADGPLLPVFTIDRMTRAQGAASRWRLGRGLAAFDRALKARTGGRGLCIVEGEAAEIFPPLMRRLGLGRVHQSDWPTADMRAAQARLRAALAPEGRTLILHPGHLLIHPGAVQTGTGGPYKVFTPFARAVRRTGPEAPSPDAPARIAAFADPPAGIDPATLDLAPDMRRGRAALERFALPAGEAAALARLDTFLDSAASYPENRDRPDIGATSALSEHLALGEIGPRTLWKRASLHARLAPGQTAGIDKFLSEVIWREFAWHLLIAFPHMAETCWRPEWEAFPWRKDGPGLEDWRRASTGVALVDAGLREMWVTGRMHNRVRMVVASWLTKHLLTDWRAGLAHFAGCLTDWDPAANAMNWQWVAGCGPDAAPYFRIFNPERQAEQFDPEGRYRHRWLGGSEGGTTPEVIAFHDSIPLSWTVPARWRPGPASALSAGREAALAALAAFRSQTPED